jgi:Protein of unknown function (DUF2785)
VKWMATLVTVFLVGLPVLAKAPPPADAAQGKPAHDREFWRAIPKNRYAVPAGQAAFPLMRELSGYLGSRDPELRDDLAYTITAVWIKYDRQLSAAELNSLADEWRANLQAGIGESALDGVLKRSFSALCLAALAERDLKTPFLGEERSRKLLADVLTYLKDENDLRGFDRYWDGFTPPRIPRICWRRWRAIAFLEAKTRAVCRVLDAISARLFSAHEIFTYGEQDRLASVAATIVKREDFDPGAFQKWLTALDAADQRVWQDSPPKLVLLQTFENDTYMLRGLAVYLCKSPGSAAVTDAQKAVLEVLQKR